MRNNMPPVYHGVFVLFVLLCGRNGIMREVDAFSCEGRATGYYADVQMGCEMYHMCDGLGRMFSYSCPNTTLFQQRMLVCDHWYMVNCSLSEKDYSANLLIGQRNKPFVDDSVEHPYQRTPRPDLASFQKLHNYQYEYHAKLQNLVGGEAEQKVKPTEKTSFGLSSRWSTEYNRETVTEIPLQFASTQNIVRTSPTRPSIDVFRGNSKTVAMKKAEPTARSLQPSAFINNKVDSEETVHIPPKFKTTSSRQAVTAKTTTKFLAPTTPSPIRKFAPSAEGTIRAPNTELEPPFFDVVSNRRHDTIIVASEENDGSDEDAIAISPPSIYYQPPKLEVYKGFEETTMDPLLFSKIVPWKNHLPKKVNGGGGGNQIRSRKDSANSEGQNTGGVTSNTTFVEDDKEAEKRWSLLKRLFFIPDYEFPLDTVTRPSYDSGISSY